MTEGRTRWTTRSEPERKVRGFFSALQARRDVTLLPATTIAGRALVTVIAIMTFLAALTAGSALLIAGASADWQGSVAREVTVQVRPVAGKDIETEVARAVALVRRAPGIAEVSAFSKDDAQKMLEPWLGSGLDLGSLPIPRLIVVKLAFGASADLPALRQSLADAVAGSSLDDHQLWLARLSAMAHTVVAVGGLVLALVLTALALAVGFATRGVMAGNREIISVLHFVGAEDRFIAREFQRHFRRLGLRGGLIGGGGAALVFLIGGAIGNALAATPGGDELQALFGAFGLGMRGYLAILVIAGCVAVGTGAVSRAIVFRHLRGPP